MLLCFSFYPLIAIIDLEVIRLQKEIDKLVNLLKNSKNTVVVTGAGISTEAGIPDFRGENGIYRKLGENRVMNIVNIDFFRRNPEKFYEFYREYFMFPAVEPSLAHYLLAEMETKGFVKAIVTQNIDNLHQKAGSKRVIAIHGNADRFKCTAPTCRMAYNGAYAANCPDLVPTCAKCGHILKPDVVLFGEQIQNFMDAHESVLSARLLIVIGSSLTVYPLAGFVKEFSTFTQDLVIINKGYTALDHAAMLKIDTGNTGELLQKVYGQL
jgi:NAD-dependent protein deacetylases, SIR2 family